MSKVSKQPLDLVLRRRAAYMTLVDVLEGEQLLQAMWMIEERDQKADKFVFLGIVGVTAEIFGVDNQVISTLYTKLNHNLSLSSLMLPPDPMPQMMRQRGIKTKDELQLSVTASSIFKTNDILASVEDGLNNSTLLQIGQSLATEARESNCSCMIMARDDHEQSYDLSQELAKGILSTGINVIDLGKVPLPVLNFVTHHFDGRAGVMISGGHYDDKYNGLKMLVAGEVLEGESVKKIKQRIDNQDFFISDTKGKLEKNTTYINEYIGMVDEDIQLSKPLKVVLGGGKGIVGLFARELFQVLGCEVIEFKEQGFQVLGEMGQAVRQNGADIGISFDNEGVRLRVLDSQGEIIRSDKLLMLFASNILKAYPISQIIHDTHDLSNLASWIIKNAGQPILFKKGSAFMKQQVLQTGAKLAGDMHGHIYFNDRWFGFDDAVYAAARLLQLLSMESRLSHDIFSELPTGLQELNFKLDLSTAEIQQIVAKFTNSESLSGGNVTDTDGFRVDFKNAWMLMRIDQSSSSLMIHFEADNDSALEEMIAELKMMFVDIKPNLDIA